MTVTVRRIITRAYRIAGVVASGEQMEAEQASDGLEAFNDMLHAWRLRGVKIYHTDLGLNDEFLLEDRFREGAVLILAARLGLEYAQPVNFDEDAWFREVQAFYAEVPELTIPEAVRHLPSRRGWWT